MVHDKCLWHEFRRFVTLDCACSFTATVGTWGVSRVVTSYSTLVMLHTASALQLCLELTYNFVAWMMQHTRVRAAWKHHILSLNSVLSSVLNLVVEQHWCSDFDRFCQNSCDSDCVKTLAIQIVSQNN